MQDIIKKANEIAEIYKEELYETLEDQSNMIYKNLKRNLERLCKESKLVTSNSVYQELFPFSIIYRVKKPESLKEKIIRKTLYNDIYNSDRDILAENISKKVDDLIGITILLDTNKNIDIFSEFIFDEKVYGLKSISKKEESMRKFGDLRYFNIKAIYDSSGLKKPVEIQIKSTIVSALTNMQHKLIYKNRDVSIMKDNNDLIIKSITPSILAIENVIDSVEKSFVNSEKEVNTYNRQKEIQKLIYEKSGDSPIFDVFIKDIDEIVHRSLRGYIIKKSEEESEENVIEEAFWNEFNKENKESSIEFENEEFILQILWSIGNISEDFIENIVYFDYINKYVPHLKEETSIGSDILNDIEQFVELLKFLESKETNIYEKLLLDKRENIIEIIMNSVSAVSEFLENESDVNIDPNKISEINKAVLLFVFDNSAHLDSLEIDDLFLNTSALEEKLSSLRGEF
ncbi:hypothetical protein [Bacillus altitudinis]|uniref:hypothetical protein n=1 Tax=Bacillus altitudinis TaxID=293387 RepID=UPI003D1E58CD